MIDYFQEKKRLENQFSPEPIGYYLQQADKDLETFTDEVRQYQEAARKRIAWIQENVTVSYSLMIRKGTGSKWETGGRKEYVEYTVRLGRISSFPQEDGSTGKDMKDLSEKRFSGGQAQKQAIAYMLSRIEDGSQEPLSTLGGDRDLLVKLVTLADRQKSPAAADIRKRVLENFAEYERMWPNRKAPVLA